MICKTCDKPIEHSRVDGVARCACPCHPVLRNINGGTCPICDIIPTVNPITQIEIVTDSTDKGEQGDWRSHARSILGPIIAQLPEDVLAFPANSTSAKVYKAPPVGVKPAIKYVADTASKALTHQEIEAELCRRSLAYFVRAYWPVFAPGIKLHWNWHLEMICKHVQAVLEEWMKKQRDPDYKMLVQNLAVNCPPRSLKSTIVSICTPAWMWLRFPSWKSIFVSSNPRVAVRDARGCRKCLESEWYQAIKATIAAEYPEGSPERHALEWELVGAGDLEYSNSAGGVRIAMSFKTMATGQGADAIFIDDPNDAKKVMSEKERASVNDTWDLALCNRVNDYNSSVRIMIMQRLHEMDLTGHWRTVMPIELTFYLAIPLEFDRDMDIENEKSPFGYYDPRTEEGVLLHPARLDHGPALEAERVRLGPYGFAGQMNQKPVPLEGGSFKRAAWNFFYIASAERHHHGLTGSIVDHNRGTFDYVGGTKIPMGKDSALQWAPIDPLRKPSVRPKGCDTSRPAIPMPFLDRLVISVDASFGSEKATASRVCIIAAGMRGVDKFLIENRTKVRSVDDTKDAIRQIVRDFPSASVVLIERKAAGHDVCVTLKSEISGITPIDDNSNWMDRANGMLPGFLAGNWYILEGAQWSTSIVNEFSMFPNGAHDDQIDTCSQLAKYYFGASGNGGTLSAGW